MKTKKILTLCIVHDHPRVLLGMKKRGFGAGRWNGFGGKVEPGESVEDAARREMREEAGIEAEGLEEVGVLDFEFKDDPKILETHLFKAVGWSGEPVESEEMKPRWFPVDEIPFSQMWSDDAYWMPLFLKGRKFKARFLFDQPSTAERQAVILEKHIEEVE
ncbi:MAG: 8-oxo-dGTP diphosphatase [Patescibacteria group bacterium]|nr:8-oxo-dGTP diphosphatase [Patescibacteria group bacterium]